MTARRRLSIAMRSAQKAARSSQLAQNEMHDAFEEVYGVEFDVENIGGEVWVDALVYGHGRAPTLKEVDDAMRNTQEDPQ